MDKNAIKKYAVWARNELIERVTQKAQQYGITAKDFGDENTESIDGRLLSDTEKKQRKALIQRIKVNSFEHVMEEVAYTWFNRFTALRFMEVNNYLPSHTRVFTNEENEFKPQILADAISLEIEGLDMDKVFELKNDNKDEELYKYLLIIQCNALSTILPGMFQKIEDYTELLLPDYLLREGSFVEQMISLIPEGDWTDQVEILGWLYQYYNTEPKAKVFGRVSTAKIAKEDVPAATQLFTPDWIVRYMVENSLGRFWLNGHKESQVGERWQYYIADIEHDTTTQRIIDEINMDKANCTPDQIKCIDPCQGSGHVLSYLFDVLMDIYEDYGYSGREAVESIVRNNIYGLDIDDRASQLAYFAVMMKGRQYDRRFFSRGIQPHVYSIKESNNVDDATMSYFIGGNNIIKREIEKLCKVMTDSKEYGSLLSCDEIDFSVLKQRLIEIEEENSLFTYSVKQEIEPLLMSAQLLGIKYDVVCTNPPYMGSRKGMNPKLKKYVEKNYPDSKSDLYTCFIEKCLDMAKQHRYVAMITMQSFMFTDDYKELRAKLLKNHSFVNMAHLGADAFPEINGEVVQTTAFIIGKNYPQKASGVFERLVDYPCDEKPKMLHSEEIRFVASSEIFENIKATPISYWLSPKMRESFNIGIPFEDYGRPRAGITTGENDRFLRMWHEVKSSKIGLGYESVEEFHASQKLYIPYNKGGLQIKWYGNNDYVIMFDEKNYNILSNQGNHLPSRQYYCLPCMTWSDISGRSFAARYCGPGFVFDVKGSCGFPDSQNLWLTLAFLNSVLTPKYIDSLNPTTTTQVGDLKRIPIIPLEACLREKIDELSKRCVEISKADYDSKETSWDFKKNPLVCGVQRVSEAYLLWEKKCNDAIDELKMCEEEINKIFINAYGLESEIESSVSLRDISLQKPDKTRAVKDLLSYAVGCMFGRYSLDKEGLVFAGDSWSDEDYATFCPDKDAIIPICDDEYFSDDIVNRFIEFIRVVYGNAHIDENLRFIADALGGKGTPKEVIRNYFLNGFYTDHLRTYQKRPIYWLFDAGKKSSFRCLVYMHRYQPDTIARIRTDYVHELQSRYRTATIGLEQQTAGSSTGERVKINRRLAALEEQTAELRVYEEKIHHLADKMVAIDLDDGVKTNYAKFADVLSVIK